jgi:hypothetical protein
MNEIKVYHNFLTPQEQTVIDDIIFQPIWRFGHGSTTGSNNPFWQIHGLETDEFFSVKLLNKIKEKTGDDFDVERIYMNGHTAGGHGNIHTDTQDDKGRTFLIYCNQTWNPEFGGSTVFLDGDKVLSTYPYPYSAVYFQNNIEHFAGPLSRNFNGLRVTLAFKLFLK